MPISSTCRVIAPLALIAALEALPVGAAAQTDQVPVEPGAAAATDPNPSQATVVPGQAIAGEPTAPLRMTAATTSAHRIVFARNAKAVIQPVFHPPAIEVQAGHQGNVVIRGIVGSDGIPTDLVVDTSSGAAGYDQAAIANVSKWRFQPALERGGGAVPQDLRATVSYWKDADTQALPQKVCADFLTDISWWRAAHREDETLDNLYSYRVICSYYYISTIIGENPEIYKAVVKDFPERMQRTITNCQTDPSQMLNDAFASAK